MSWVLDTCYQKYCLSLVGVNPYRMKDKVNYLRCCLFVQMRLVEIQLIFSHFPFFFKNRMLITYNINITYNELLSGLVNDFLAKSIKTPLQVSHYKVFIHT